MAECFHESMYIEFRDQFPRSGEAFIPEANGIWKVCKDCGYEEQDAYLTLAENWGREMFDLDDS